MSDWSFEWLVEDGDPARELPDDLRKEYAGEAVCYTVRVLRKGEEVYRAGGVVIPLGGSLRKVEEDLKRRAVHGG